MISGENCVFFNDVVNMRIINLAFIFLQPYASSIIMAKNSLITYAFAEQNKAVKRNEHRLQPELNV